MHLPRDWATSPSPIKLFITDAAGGGVASLLYSTSGLVVSYSTNDGSSFTALTKVTATLGTYTSSGFIAGPVAGDYWIGLPTGALPEGGRCLVSWSYNGVSRVGEIRADLAPTALTSARAGTLPITGTMAVIDGNGNVPANLATLLGSAGDATLLRYLALLMTGGKSGLANLSGNTTTAVRLSSSTQFDAPAGSTLINVTKGQASIVTASAAPTFTVSPALANAAATNDVILVLPPVGANAAQLGGKLVTAAAAVTFPAAVSSFDTTSQFVALATTQPNYAPAKAGDPMTLTAGERDATATRVEYHLLDDGDGTLFVNAIVGAIGNTNLDQVAVVAAIRADLERTGGKLQLIDAKTGNLPAAFPANFSAMAITSGGQVTSASVTGNVGGITGVAFPTGFSGLTVAAIQSGLSTLNATGVRAALGMASANFDVQLAGLGTAIGAGGGSSAISDADKAAIVAQVIAGLAGRQLISYSPVMTDGSLAIYAGDAYTTDRPIRWDYLGYTGPSLNGTAIALRLIDSVSFARAGASAPHAMQLTGTIVQAGTTLTLSFTASAADTAALAIAYPAVPAPTHQAQVIATSIDLTLVDVPATVNRRIS